MTLKEFTNCSEIEQIRVLMIYGVLLAERNTGDNKIYLYAIGSFYIELFHELSNIRITGPRILKTFDDVKLLDDYLLTISLPAFG